VTLLILALSVAADATAVAIASSVRGITFARGLLMAAMFGAAQALMAAIGWAGGAALGDLWKAWDHWIALALLTAVGVKMIREAFDESSGSSGFLGSSGTASRRGTPRNPEEPRGNASAASLLVLTIATSLDALAVGVSLPTLGARISIALLMIGVVTFVLSAAGAWLGRYLGERFGRVVEVAGGLGLIAIGVRIVVEHIGG
jgi:manganese efflux pump family protein